MQKEHAKRKRLLRPSLILESSGEDLLSYLSEIAPLELIDLNSAISSRKRVKVGTSVCELRIKGIKSFSPGSPVRREEMFLE